MSYGNEGAVWLKIVMFGMLAVGGIVCGINYVEPAGYANKHVRKMLSEKGYSDVKIHQAENHWGAPIGWACGDEDYHLIEFRAKNGAGNPEEGFVCCGRMEPIVGYSKGCTIRN